MPITRFSALMIEKIQTYVYCLIDPRNGEVFYVGKGKANRVFAHLKQARSEANGDKLERIREIWQVGLEPKIDILRHGLTEDVAFEVEGTAIHLVELMGGNLTNLVNGHGVLRGRVDADELEARSNRKISAIKEPVVLIKIGREYSPDLTPEQLYERTRRWWRVSLSRQGGMPPYAMAISNGLIREVYNVDRWMPANEDSAPIDRSRFDPPDEVRGVRSVFVGSVAKDKAHYIGKSVDHIFSQGSQNPIRYLNC